VKLWSAILVICLLALTVQGVFAVKESGTDTNSAFISEAPLNPEYIAYKNGFQPLEWLNTVWSKDQLGYIPEPTDTSHLKGKKVSKKALEAEVQGISDVPAGDTGEIVSATPATYDLRTSGRVSPVKNQGGCGSCWAFATYGSMESEALPGQLYDFSENNLKNTHGFDVGPCAGGNSQMATAYLARWSGAVAETDDPYVDTSTSSPSGLPVQEHATEILEIPGRSGPLDNGNIKAALQTTGALYTTMYWSSSYYNDLSDAYYYSGTSSTNHAVTIVGWDDTYSRTNFLTAPPGDGAFIVKNSWGTLFGNGGYFYLSYYDSNVGKSLTAFTGESAANYNTVYQYDPLGWLSNMGYRSDTAWAANVFTATSGESLRAVGISTNQVDTAYQVFIYTNPDNGPLSSAGPVSTTQGTIGIPGYHTITLPAPVSLNSGQKFSVVVRLQTPNYNYPIAIEKPYSDYSSKATASPGQSYTSSTGTSWTDLTTSIPNANVCLKAYTVKTGSSAPVAAFSGTPLSGTVPLTVQFTDTSTNSPTSWLWTFGDGGTATSKNPSHLYTTVGTYTITLTATNSVGSNTLTKTAYITVISGSSAPVAAFSGTPVSGTVPLTVQFTDISTNTPTSWAWTFGDGGTSTSKNPSHLYATVGTYTVTLTATNSVGSNTLTKTAYITVTSATSPPIAGFWGTPVSGTVPLTVQFTDTSTNSPTSWLWTFGDGGTATSKNPSHQYTAAGKYNVSLTATNSAGSNKLTNIEYVIVTSGSSAPVAAFSGTPVSGTVPIIVQFTDTSTNTPTSWAWTFGDGGTSTSQNPSHIYTATGTYSVTLTAKNTVGSNTLTKSGYITVNTAPVVPVAAFSGTPVSGTVPLIVQFTDTSTNIPTSWAWTFGDGGTSTSQNPSHTYTAVGTYSISLTAKNTAGGNTLTKSGYITVNTAPTPTPTPVPLKASFIATPVSGKPPLNVAFTDTSTGTPISWVWNFGDGTTSSIQQPTHSYATAGFYTVTLTVSNANGTSSQIVKKNCIKVQAK